MSVRKLTSAGILTALGVVCSTFYIPIGVSKVFPIQHAINVLAGVLLGPLYAVCMAFVTSFLRVMMGTGTLLAFPGSMCGAFLCGLLYQHTRKYGFAFLGEVLGTGVIGAVLAYPVAAFLLSKDAAMFAFIIPFSFSSFAGALLSLAVLLGLKRTGLLNKVIREQII